MFEIEKIEKKDSVPRTIRFGRPMFEQLQQIAVDHDISFNLLVIQCCQYAIDHMKKDK